MSERTIQHTARELAGEFYDVVRAASYPTAGFYGEAFQRIEREDFANLFVDREALVTAAE